MAAGDRDPMRMPLIPASATADALDPQHFGPTFETLIIQNAVAHLKGLSRVLRVKNGAVTMPTGERA